MKKLFLAISILAVALFGFSGTASAATCAVAHGPTQWQADGNFLRFYATVWDCNNVDQVEMVRSSCDSYGVGCGSNTSTAGWLDTTQGAWHFAGAGLTPDIRCGRVNVYFNDQCGTTYYVHPWCGGATHYVKTQFIFRIHQFLGQWGPWHYSDSGAYPIVC